MSDAKQASRAAAAERMRRSRERQRKEMVFVGIEVKYSEVDELVRRGLLATEAQGDTYEIAGAIEALLETTLHR